MNGDRFGSLRPRVRRLLAVAVLSCLAGLAGAQTPTRHRSVAGQLLVASESMGDPRFAETVILMIEHDETGALGLVVNRLLGAAPVAKVMERLGLEPSAAQGDIAVHAGGPVEPNRGFVLHSAEVMAEGSGAVAKDIAVTTGPGILRLIGRGAGPRRSLFAFGYAGWGPGQLDGELARADWFLVPADPDLVFAPDPAQTWLHATERRGVDL